MMTFVKRDSQNELFGLIKRLACKGDLATGEIKIHREAGFVIMFVLPQTQNDKFLKNVTPLYSLTVPMANRDDLPVLHTVTTGVS